MEINYSGKNVLIVDSKLPELDALRQMLGKMGVERIQAASSVNMALSLMRIEQYDLCFVNYDLGRTEKNGLQLLHEANAEGLLNHRNLFVLVVDQERSHLLFGSLENSPDTYISKPYDIANVRARLDKVMRVKHVTDPVSKLWDEGALPAAIERCDELVNMFPGLHIYLSRLKGIMLLQTGRYAEAVDLFEVLVERRDLPWAEVGLGSAKFHLGHYDDALKMLNRVVDNEHLCVEAFSWLGRAYWAKGALNQAIALMRKAVMLQPTSPQLQRELADLAAQAEEWALAIDAYRSAIRYARYSVFQEPSAYLGLARALAHKSGESEAQEEIIRLLEDVVLEHEGYEQIGLHAKLCAADAFVVSQNRELGAQRLHDAWQMFLALEQKNQCYWLDDMVDAATESPLAGDVASQKKQLGPVMVALNWSKASLKAALSFRKGEHEQAFILFCQAYKEVPGHVGVSLNLVQAGIELARRKEDIASDTLLRCDEVLSNLRFGELSSRQQARYRVLAQRCAEIDRHVPDWV